jgi:hypothetical protein
MHPEPRPALWRSAVWLAVLAALWLAGCRSAATPGNATAAAPQPTGPEVTAAATSAPEAVPGSATALSAFEWQVDLVQGGQAQPGGTSEVTLARAPFTIRVSLPQPLPVKLNALDSDANFQLIQPGYTFTPDCMVALCTGMDVAEERQNPDRVLYVDPISTHYLYYVDGADNRWSRATVGPEGAVFERDVAALNGQPIEQWTGPALYLLVFANPANPDVVDPGELKKIIMLFQ